MSLSIALQSALVEPPVNLLVLLLAGLVMLRGGRRSCWRRRAGWSLSLVAFTTLVALALPATAWLMIAGLERNLPLQPSADAPPGAIVILSADALRAVPGGIIGPPDVGALTLERLRAGAVLHRQMGLPILVSGGVLRPGEPAIATAMARVLASELGTPARWVEGASPTTWENARLSADMLKPEGIGSIYLVTHAWHMRRAVLAFRHFGIAATAAPTHFSGPTMPDAASFVPSAKGWMESSYALHEWIGFLWYALAR